MDLPLLVEDKDKGSSSEEGASPVKEVALSLEEVSAVDVAAARVLSPRKSSPLIFQFSRIPA